MIPLLLLVSVTAAGDWLPGTEPDRVACVLVRDARTGAPLAGVRVVQYDEDASGTFLRAERLGEAVTDGFGLASIAWRDELRDCHWVFDIAGYAVREEYGALPPEIVELEPGQSLAARVFGPFGEPRRGVVVEGLLGCSHGPAVRRAVTDAEGRFAFRDVDPSLLRLWFLAPDLAATYHDAGDGDIHALPGVTLTGRILDTHGVPVPGAVVGSLQEMRGPRAVAGPDGVFRVPGVAPHEGLFAAGAEHGEAWLGRDEVDVRRPFPIVVRPRSSEQGVSGRMDPDAAPIEVPVEVVDDDTGAPLPGLGAVLVRESDGWVFDVVDGVAEAPRGRYELRVGGGFESHAADSRSIDVRAGAAEALTVRARRQPALGIDGAPLPEDVSLRVTAFGTADPPCWLPGDARAVVWAEAEGLVLRFPIGPARDGARRASVSWPEPRRIAVDGRYAWAVRGAWSEQDDDVVRTHAAGPQVLVVRDETYGAQEVPVGTSGVVGRLRPPGTLTVVRPDGGPVAGRVAIRVERLEHERGLEDGVVRSWCLRDGAHVRILRDGAVPLHRELAGDGPWRVPVPTGVLEVTCDADLDLVVSVDGALFAGTRTVRIGGLAAGAHDVLVAARGRERHDARVVLREGELLRLAVSLPER